MTCDVDNNDNAVVESDCPMVEVVLGKGDRRSMTHEILRKVGHMTLAQEKRDNGTTQCHASQQQGKT